MTVTRMDLVAAAARRMNQWRQGLGRWWPGAQVPHGLVIYEGPSRLDGQPVVVVVTGLVVGSRNRKTADLLQVYILPRDVSPPAAVKSGADAAVCGDCKHRPSEGGVCYVNIGWGPMMVWRAWQVGKSYQPADPERAAQVLAGSSVRFGAWGDPAAVPLEVWRPLLPDLYAWTGYTHQWRALDSDWHWLMASVDSVPEREAAKARGWRTFRVKEPEDGLLPGERYCLADEMGIPCAKCRGCDGNGHGVRLDYAIDYHGPDHRGAWRERQGQLFGTPIGTDWNRLEPLELGSK